MTWSYVGFGSVENGGGSSASLVIPVPSGVQNNDYLLFGITCFDGSYVAPTFPSGINTFETGTCYSTTGNMFAWGWRLAYNEPANYTATLFSINDPATGVCYAIRGASGSAQDSSAQVPQFQVLTAPADTAYTSLPFPVGSWPQNPYAATVYGTCGFNLAGDGTETLTFPAGLTANPEYFNNSAALGDATGFSLATGLYGPGNATVSPGIIYATIAIWIPPPAAYPVSVFGDAVPGNMQPGFIPANLVSKRYIGNAGSVTPDGQDAMFGNAVTNTQAIVSPGNMW
jgi:hypothetical protein